MTGKKRQSRAVIGVLFVSLLVSGAVAQTRPEHPPIIGIATVVDGDTIRINRQKVRFWAMDTPERGRHCTRADGTDVNVYKSAKAALKAMIGTSPVRCEYKMTDDSGRPVAICWQNGADLGARMVSLGHGWDWPYWGNGYYAAQDAEAKRARRGVWGMTCSNLYSGRSLTRPVPQKKKT